MTELSASPSPTRWRRGFRRLGSALRAALTALAVLLAMLWRPLP